VGAVGILAPLDRIWALGYSVFPRCTQAGRCQFSTIGRVPSAEIVHLYQF